MLPEVVVLPTYNEADNLSAVVSEVRRRGYGLVIVDDDSPDGTGRLADQIAEQDAGVAVVHRPSKQGLGPAYAHGFRVALAGGARVVFEMDADFSHDPADLARLSEVVQAGADLVIGSRYVGGGAVAGWTPGRRLLSRWGNRYARFALGIPLADATSGFRAYRATALKVVEPDTCRASGYGFQIETAWRAVRRGLVVSEVPIVFRERRLGRSKMTPRIAVEAMMLVTWWGLGRLVDRLRRAGRRGG